MGTLLSLDSMALCTLLMLRNSIQNSRNSSLVVHLRVLPDPAWECLHHLAEDLEPQGRALGPWKKTPAAMAGWGRTFHCESLGLVSLIQPPKLKLFPRDPIGANDAALPQVPDPLAGEGSCWEMSREGAGARVCVWWMLLPISFQTAGEIPELVGSGCLQPPAVQSQSGEGEQSKHSLSTLFILCWGKGFFLFVSDMR